MPVAHTPMIDYTLKFLKDNQINDITIFTSNNRAKIEEYVKKFAKKKSPEIKVFSTEERSR